MRHLSKKNDPARKWRSFRKHAMLILEPLVLAVMFVKLWQLLRHLGLYLSDEDELSLTSSVITTLAVAFSIMATLMFNTVWEKYRQVVIFVLKGDKEGFLVLRDERMPMVLHIFIAALSVLFLGMVMLLNYRQEWSGIAAVFSLSFVVALYWIVIPQLENPAKSPWFAERIPKEWLELDVDEFFKLEKERNGQKK
ncbi:hypothetical protein EPO05_01585 [Patescibacteria group bacterium]|nr:MAG: hypothetical protein EPO05_01585 [Patescibacteria group bacterium]